MNSVLAEDLLLVGVFYCEHILALNHEFHGNDNTYPVRSWSLNVGIEWNKNTKWPLTLYNGLRTSLFSLRILPHTFINSLGPTRHQRQAGKAKLSLLRSVSAARFYVSEKSFFTLGKLWKNYARWAPLRSLQFVLALLCLFHEKRKKHHKPGT